MKQIYKQLGKVRPTVEGDWSIDKTYTLLSIVYDEVGNASYISRKDVPAGIQITNKEYWTRFSNTRVDSDSIVLLSKIQDDGLINSYDLQEAIDSFKVEDRRLGTFISFYEKPIGESTDYRWNLYQFNSNNIDDWNNTKYWQSIYYIQNKFLGLFSSEESLKRTRPFPIIGDYAFVGATLKEAVVYRCNNIGVWTRTNEKAKDYLSINLKGDITISEEGNWVIDGADTGISSKGEDGKTPLLRIKDYKWQVSYDGGTIYNDIPNSPIFVKEDDEDIIGDLQTDGVKLLKFADKEYNASKFSGLGRVYLRKNIVNGKNVLTQEMINKSNTIYIIQYDYDLDNKQINVLENCTLYFQGGSLNNGILNGNYTDIISSIFIIFKDNLNIKGNWNINNAYPEWFGAIPNNNNYDNSFAINKCLSAFNKCVLTKGFYYVSSNNGESCINIEKYNILTSNINVSDYNINIENLINKIGIRIIENTNCKQIINCKGSINNIYIIGNKKTIGVYCKGSKINIDNVNILNSTIGLYTNTYVSVYKSIICALCDIGFKIEGNYLDDVLQTQNTSCTLINCYSSQNNYCGFYLKGMIYSSLINCACDNTMKYDKNNYLASYKLDDCSSINLINCGIEHTLKAIIMNKVVSSSIFIHCISNYTNINDVDSELIKSFAIFKYISSCVINIYYNISNFNFDKQFIILKDYDRDITNLFLQVRYNNINFETDGNLQNIIRKIKRNTLCLRGFNELIKSIFIALPTKERPDNVENGYSYLDTTLNKKVYYNNNNWIDYNGNPADALKKGTTAQRPTGVQIGFTYKDTDLNKWIIWNGEAWENIDGTALG